MQTYRYTITVPKHDNNKKPFDKEQLEAIFRQFLEGYTLYWSKDPQAITGYWEGYQDNNALLVYDSSEEKQNKILELCKQLKTTCKQQAIYLTKEPIQQYFI